jgi:2-polyprenyl-6-methoxyphenol hydroxylase-like FAD-dependent oxidoreductase
VQTGWEVVIIEKAAALREGEFVIDFSGTGWDVAVKMGLDIALKKQQMEISALAFKSHQGQDKSRIKMKDFVESLGVGEKHASINRRDLQNLLFDKVKERIEIRFSTSIRSLKEYDLDERVQVVFDNGIEEDFDLLIGADGLHSNVRQLAFGKEAKFAKYLGYYVSAFRVKGVSGKEPGVMKILRKPHKQAGILDLRDGDSLALFVFAKDGEQYVPNDQRKQVLIDTFGEMGGPVPAILNGINDKTSVYMDTTTQIVMPKWYAKRVVLIGDAAYCLTLVSGQGASMAMGGAYILAKELEAVSDTNIEQALARYDARLRPFVEELQGKSRKFAANFIPSSRFGLWIMDKVVTWVSNPIVKRLIGKKFSIQSLFEREAAAKG